MPKYAALVKYTPQALEGVRADGYASRPVALHEFAASMGGKIEFMEFIANGEYDFLGIFDMPSSDSYLAMTSFAGAAGAVERSVIYELHSGEEIDAAVKAHTPDYTPPGG